MEGKYSRFRELWAVPRFRALFKMAGWVLFFAVFLLIFILGGGHRPIQDNRLEPETISYSQMQTNLENANLNINFYVTASNDFFLDGTINNNVLEAILENDELTRVRITPEVVYIITRDEETLTDKLDELNLVLLFPNQIIELIKQSEVEGTVSADNRIFFYTIDELNISVHTNEEAIYKIVILDGNITYELEFSII